MSKKFGLICISHDAISDVKRYMDEVKCKWRRQQQFPWDKHKTWSSCPRKFRYYLSLVDLELYFFLSHLSQLSFIILQTNLLSFSARIQFYKSLYRWLLQAVLLNLKFCGQHLCQPKVKCPLQALGAYNGTGLYSVQKKLENWWTISCNKVSLMGHFDVQSTLRLSMQMLFGLVTQSPSPSDDVAGGGREKGGDCVTKSVCRW